LTEDLKDFEDLYVRNTDSMIEYHALGDITQAMPTSILENRLAKEELDDNRSGSRPYYKAYLAQRYLSGIEAAFHKDEGLRLCNEALDELRPGPDAGLMVQLLVLKLQNTTEGTQEYRAMAEKVMSLAPAEIRNHGLRFPVQEIGLPPELSAVLERSIFFDDPAATHAITGKMDSSGVKLSLTSPHSTKVHSANTESPAAAFDMLADMFFRQDL